MPVAKRSFVISLAAIYRINTELVDVEPQRSVMIRRRIDTRIPLPALSTAANAKPASFGGLTNLRAPAPTRTPSTGWGGSTTGWGKQASNKGYARTLSEPGSGGVTPSGPSRTTTPQPASGTASTSRAAQPQVTVPQGQRVVGEVGKVEDEGDWDVDA